MGSAVSGFPRFVRRLAALAVLLLFWAAPAWANQPPGPQMFLAEVLILPLMMLFTALGGGYAVMQARGVKRRRYYMVLAMLAILLSGIHEGYGAMLMIVFGIVALGRAGRLIVWGIGALRPPEKRRAHLAQAVPLRLILAGLLTVVTAVGLAGLRFAFLSWWPSESYVEQDLKRLVAYQLAHSKQHKDASGNPQYEGLNAGALKRAENFPGEPILAFEELRLPFLHRETTGKRRYFATEFRLAPGAKSFQVWVWPQRMTFFPYNYVVTLPSFYADETGQIRMIRVHWAGQKCSPDAPVYYRVRPEDLAANVAGPDD